MTANQMTGYDVDTGKLVAKGLGVEACFVAPTWTEITAGQWGDRWDSPMAPEPSTATACSASG